MTLQHFYEYLVREEAYDASSLNCYAFLRGNDVKDGITMSFGNMVGGYDFALLGAHFNNSECAYIAGAFSLGTSNHLAIQQQLTESDNGFQAKRCIHKPHKDEKRTDWESFNVQWMVYVVWQKCLCNDAFRKLIMSLPSDAVIIENSTFQRGATATLWGTRNDELKSRLNALRKALKAQGKCKAAIKREMDMMRLGEWSAVGFYRGKNVMGKILMACKQALVQGTEPPIDYALLESKHINILGRELSFLKLLNAA